MDIVTALALYLLSSQRHEAPAYTFPLGTVHTLEYHAPVPTVLYASTWGK